MLTRSGLGAVVTAALLAVLGAVWNYEELVLISIGTSLIVLLAVFVAQRKLRATVVRRLVNIRVQRGDAIVATYRIINDTDHRSGRATLIDCCDESVVEVAIEPVGAGEIAEVTAPIPTRRRGVFPLGPLEIRKIDPFYLAVGRRRDDSTNARNHLVTVHPRVYELTGPQGESRVVENESIMRRPATDPMSGFISMREYVPGDDPRMIHWPTTARTGSLMVRENVEVRRPEFTVVVDTGGDTGTDDDFEEIVDVAATLAVHALRSGLDVVVRTTDREHPGHPTSLRSEAAVVDLLTPVQRRSDQPPLELSALFAHGLDHTSVLVVTGPNGPTSRIHASQQMMTIRIGEGAEAGGGIAIAATDARDFVSRWRTRS